MRAIEYPKLLASAIAVLKRQGVISYPTEGVWGLGCDPMSEVAVRKVLRLKNRSISKGLILIGSSHQQFARLLEDLDDRSKRRFVEKRSKPTTWLVPSNDTIPPWITGDHDSVAVRITKHPVAKGLCEVFGRPIVSTSCNPQGAPPATSQSQVKEYFGDKLDYFVMGEIERMGSVSDIIDLKTNKVIRLG